MKRYSDKENNLYIVGSADDIKATYKAICRHNTWDCWQTHIEPEFLDFPEFSESKKIYGLCIDEDCKMTVVNSDTLLDLIIKDEIKEEVYEMSESVEMEEIEEPYHNEYFEPSDYIREYNEYRSEIGYEGFYSFDELDEMLQGYSPIDIIRMWNFGDSNNFMDEYFTFNGYGNIKTCSESQIIQEIKNDPDFFSWLVDNNYIEIDEEEAQEIINEANNLIKQGY